MEVLKREAFIIAEIGQAHDGSLGILHSYIDALKDTGVHAIKFQTHIAEAESSEFEPFRVKFSYVDKTRFDYWKRMSFTVDQWREIKAHCEAVNLEFMSSPFSNAAVDLLEEIGVKRYKIGSGEVNNFLLLERVGKTGKPIILSSGMSSLDELDDTINFLKPFGNELSILQCTTSYPTKPNQLGLNVINELKEKYKIKVGFSDHSGSIFPSIAAFSLGADILEFHAVFDKRMFGPDSTSSLTIKEIQDLCTGVSMIQESLNNPINKRDNSSFSQLKLIFEKSLAVNKSLNPGHVIQIEDLEGKKPSNKGIPSKNYQEVLGKKLKVFKNEYEFLNLSDLE